MLAKPDLQGQGRSVGFIASWQHPEVIMAHVDADAGGAAGMATGMPIDRPAMASCQAEDLRMTTGKPGC